MILYLDASALVKRYVVEPGSAEVCQFCPVDAAGKSLLKEDLPHRLLAGAEPAHDLDRRRQRCLASAKFQAEAGLSAAIRPA